jgi:prepilin-type N-terminal cleavage/methylation domain-containing protein
MRRDPQRGMTLVELLVSMAVTSILLVGLTSAFFDVSGVYGKWANRLQGAQISTGLAASLQLDTRRYVFCGQTQPGGIPEPYLDLCWPDQLGTPAVRYRVNGSQPWVITRQAGQTATFMARSATPAGFWIDCFDHEGKTISGHVHLYDFRQGDGLGGTSSENFSVYYVAPWRNGCPLQ